jgi:mRNA-degrading endonuclease YafQ of YafQ-DinJ toxin-antitoxin module
MRRVRTTPTFESNLSALLEIPEAIAFLQRIIEQLRTKQSIPPQHRDHLLTGGLLRGSRSVVVGWLPLDPDDPTGEQLTFILLYAIEADALVLKDIGQHDDLYAAYRHP